MSCNTIITLPCHLKVIDGSFHAYSKGIDVTPCIAPHDMKDIITHPNIEIECDVPVECSAKYIPESNDFFDHGFGNWLPGVKSELDNLSAVCAGIELIEIISQADYDSICEKLSSSYDPL